MTAPTPNQKCIHTGFTSEIRNCLDLFSTPMALRTFSRKLCNNSIQSLNANTKNFRNLNSRSLDYTELGHFTFLFCRGRQRNEQLLFFSSPFV